MFVCLVQFSFFFFFFGRGVFSYSRLVCLYLLVLIFLGHEILCFAYWGRKKKESFLVCHQYSKHTFILDECAALWCFILEIISIKYCKYNDNTFQVSDVKKNIETVQGSDIYPATQQMLIHQGKVLKDGTTLGENNVAENSFVVIMLTKVIFFFYVYFHFSYFLFVLYVRYVVILIFLVF